MVKGIHKSLKSGLRSVMKKHIYFFFTFRRNKVFPFICLADNSHEMSRLIFSDFFLECRPLEILQDD